MPSSSHNHSARLSVVRPGSLTFSHLLQVAANLMTDEMLMRSAQLTPEYRPLVDFHVQYSTVQSQKGWRYGYTDAERPMEMNTTFHEMVWHPHKNGHIADGRWQATEVGLFSSVLSRPVNVLHGVMLGDIWYLHVIPRPSTVARLGDSCAGSTACAIRALVTRHHIVSPST